MIIAISGKIKSGKDTVARMLQFLDWKERHDNSITYPEFHAHYHRQYDGDWQIKRFADPIKDIVCMLIGCSRAQLEDQEFKQKPLGEEWNRWEVYNNSNSEKNFLLQRLRLLITFPSLAFRYERPLLLQKR